MPSNKQIKEKQERIITICEILKKYPDCNRENLEMTICEKYKICLRTAKEDIKIADWKVKNAK